MRTVSTTIQSRPQAPTSTRDLATAAPDAGFRSVTLSPRATRILTFSFDSAPPRSEMFGFHKPKMYRSLDGCCICRAKSSSSRFTDSKRYEKDFKSCFGLSEARSGEICNACVLLVKRWKKLPVGTKKNWNHVVDARGGPSLKLTSRPKKIKSISKKARPSQIGRLQKELKRNSLFALSWFEVYYFLVPFYTLTVYHMPTDSDAHSTTSSASPAQSPSYSNLSDDGSDSELSAGSSRSPVFSFLDLTYWKRQKVCCGIIYKGRFGEVLIDPHLFKPCCRKKQHQQQEEEEEEDEEEEEEEELSTDVGRQKSPADNLKQQREMPTCHPPAPLCVTVTTSPTSSVAVTNEAAW